MSSTTSAAALLGAARARFRESAARSVATLDQGASRLDADPTDAATLDALRAELRRVVGWAESFQLVGVALLASGLDARLARWTEDATADALARAEVVREGARLLTTFLADAADRPDVEPIPGHAAADQHQLPRGPDVVIVEDEPAMTNLLVFGLRQIGLEAVAFDSGARALDALRAMPAGHGRPLVLMDVELPGLDGHAVHEQIEAERPGAFTFVFTSGRISEGEQVRAIMGGALDYVTKPVSLRVLMAKIPRWLAAGAAAASAAAASASTAGAYGAVA